MCTQNLVSGRKKKKSKYIYFFKLKENYGKDELRFSGTKGNKR